MNSCEIVSFVTAISCAIANCVPNEELPLVAAIIGQIATTLTTIAANEELLESKQPPSGATQNQEPQSNITPNPSVPGGANIPNFIAFSPDTAALLTTPPNVSR